MAERFTRLNGPNIAHAMPQSIDFANMREEAKAAQAMSQTADRLGNWMFKLAHEQAEIEGAKYYAENPITLDQIQQAQALGKDPEELFAGTFTTFDKAGRKVQMQQISAEIELQARTELNAILGDIKLGKMDLDELTDMSSGSPRPGGRLADLVDGLSSVVKDAAPEIYPTVRANLATLANSTLSSAIGEHATRTLKERKVKAQKGVQSIIEAIPAVVERGDVIDPKTGKTVTVEMQLDLARQSLDNFAAYANDEGMQKQAREDFNKAVKTARVAALTDWADKMPEGPLAALQEIRSGKFSSPSMQAAYDNLDEDDQIKVREDIRKLRRDRLADRAAEDAAKIRIINENDRLAEDRFFAARKAGDMEGMKEAAASMSPSKGASFEDIMRENANGYTKGVASNREGLERNIMRIGVRGVTAVQVYADIEKSLAEGNITETEATDLFGKLSTQQTEKVRSAKILISSAVRYDPNADTFALEKEEVARRKATYESLIAGLTSAYEADPELNVREWVDTRLESVMRRETERELANQQKALKRMAGFVKDLGLDPEMPSAELSTAAAGHRENSASRTVQNYLDARSAVERLREELGLKND